jgi:hypothetical protein
VPPPPLFHADGVTTRWVKRLRHRESGQADSDELEQQWAEQRVQKGKEAEQKSKDDSKKPIAAPKPAEAPKAAEPARAAPRPSDAQPRPPAQNAKMDQLFEGVDTSSLTGARPISPQPSPLSNKPVSRPAVEAPRPARNDVSGSSKSGSSIEIAEDLLEDGEVSYESPPERPASRQQDAEDDPPPDDEAAEESGGEYEQEEQLDPEPPKPLRRPGPSAPKPTAGLRTPGSRRPAPSRGFGAPQEPEDAPAEEDDVPPADRTVIRDPRRR